MRGLAAVFLVVATAPAAAEPELTAVLVVEKPDPPAKVIGYAALPGGISVPDADTLPAGTISIGAIGGYGYRKGLLADNHRLDRGLGDLGFAYTPIDGFALALAFDGRYDIHYGVAPSGDDGYVGDPHLIARFSKPVGDNRFGAQLGLWVPGKNAPSVAASAISVDARGLASFQAGPARLSLEVGFRLDNSAKSIDDVTTLSDQDRVSLGVSDYNALIAGAHIVIPAGKGFIAGEVSTDVFFGAKAPPGSSTEIKAPGPIVRGAVSAGVHLGAVSLLAYVELATVPGIDANAVMTGNIPLIPYEPMVTGGIGLSGSFGGSTRHVIPPPDGPSEKPCAKTNTCKPIEVIVYAELAGVVSDQSGKPIVGGKVTVKLKNETGSAVTDEKGAYTVTKLKIGKTVDSKKELDDTGAEIAVEVAGKKPATATLTLAEGANTAPPIKLEPVLPPGQLRGTVRNAASGKAIAGATITVEPGGTTATSDAQGRFTLDLPPGTYKATATASGLATQTLDVVIEPDPNGAAVIKNFELRK